MRGQANVTLSGAFVPAATCSISIGMAPQRSTAPASVGNQHLRRIGIIFATNTALFCALDMAQWLAEQWGLSTLPTNMVAATIATTLALAFTTAGRLNGAKDD